MDATSSDYETRRLMSLRNERLEAEAAWCKVLLRDWLSDDEAAAVRELRAAFDAALAAGDRSALLDLEQRLYTALGDANFPESGHLDEDGEWSEDCGEPEPHDTDRALSYDALIGPASKMLPLFSGALRREWERVTSLLEMASEAGLGRYEMAPTYGGKMVVRFAQAKSQLTIDDLHGCVRVAHGEHDWTLGLERRLGLWVESVRTPIVWGGVEHTALPIPWLRIQAQHLDEVELIEAEAKAHELRLKVRWYDNCVYLTANNRNAWLSRKLVASEVRATLAALATGDERPAAREVTLFGYDAQGVAL